LGLALFGFCTFVIANMIISRSNPTASKSKD
jgi:hypothetical protein